MFAQNDTKTEKRKVAQKHTQSEREKRKNANKYYRVINIAANEELFAWAYNYENNDDTNERLFNSIASEDDDRHTLFFNSVYILFYQFCGQAHQLSVLLLLLDSVCNAHCACQVNPLHF